LNCQDYNKLTCFDCAAELRGKLEEAQKKIEELQIKPSVFCDGTNCQYASISYTGDGWSEPYGYDFECSKCDELDAQGYNTFEDDDSFPMCPMFRANVSGIQSQAAEPEIERLQAENDALKEQMQQLIKAHKEIKYLTDNRKEEIRRLMNGPGAYNSEQADYLVSKGIEDWKRLIKDIEAGLEG
jgi:DNA repair exonuclease SbcCD ATPase subunit